MTYKITLLFTCLLFISTVAKAQTLFNWDTNATQNIGNVTETIDGITATFTGTSTTELYALGNGIPALGDVGNVVFSSDFSKDSSSVTFGFNPAVNVNSITAIDGYGSDLEYTFTPTGGSNSVVTHTLASGVGFVTLGWTGVTSFTVSSATPTVFGFDFLEVTVAPLSTNDFNSKDVVMYPNPVKDMLNFKNVKSLKAIKVYNNLGQLILVSMDEKVDFTKFNKGIYFLQLYTASGIETKKIIKE